MSWPTPALADLLTVGSGAFVGLTLGIIGGGGSILAVPLLVYVVGIPDTHVAIGTSAVAVSACALGNLIVHARAGTVRWLMALQFALPGALGAFAGAGLGRHTSPGHLLLAFAGLMIFIALRMLIVQSSVRAPIPERAAPRRLLWFGLGTGVLAGYFGIGGGFLIVPGLVAASGMPLLNAIGSSLVGVTALGLTTGLDYLRAGLVDWRLAAEMIAGGLCGGVVGQRLAIALAADRNTLNRLFAGALLLVALSIIVRELRLMM